MLFGTLFMAFLAVRYVSLFVICSSVVLRYTTTIKNVLDKVNENDLKSINITAILMVELLPAAVGGSYISENKYPVEAVEVLKNNINSNDKIFNYYDWGRYLMLNGIKAYIDSRCDLYTEEYNGCDIAGDHNKLSF